MSAINIIKKLINRFPRLKKIALLLYVPAWPTRYKKMRFKSIQKLGFPVNFRLTEQFSISLYPEGQICELLYTNQFEQVEINLVSNYLKPGMNVIDIGGNIGLYSILFAKIIDQGKIWTFEPSSESYSRLINNLKINNVNSVVINKLALSDKHSGFLELLRDPGFKDGDRYLLPGNVKMPIVNNITTGDWEKIPVTTLDYYWKSIGCPRIDFLKMDIEGGEFNVFQGATNFLKRNVYIVMMFECTDQCCSRYGHTMKDVISLLRKVGFNIYSWDNETQRWETICDDFVIGGNLWACRDAEQLPVLKNRWRAGIFQSYRFSRT